MTMNPLEPISASSPTTYPGMGTILIPGGVAFRVWAPFASELFAVGTFNQWSTTTNPFASEGNGYWSVEVPGAKMGDEYQLVIVMVRCPIWRKNPYASEWSIIGQCHYYDPTYD
jgi:1,4-alpha-glucan branching enzyme